METENCANCHYWLDKQRVNEPGTGYCRLNPPTRIEEGRSTFPTTNNNTWCGSWKKSTWPAPVEKPAQTMIEYRNAPVLANATVAGKPVPGPDLATSLPKNVVPVPTGSVTASVTTDTKPVKNFASVKQPPANPESA